MSSTYTVCFCEAWCARDEGEETRTWDYKAMKLSGTDKKIVVSDKGIYDKDTGYIPVRIHMDISGDDDLKCTKEKAPSVTVRGVRENDWYDQQAASDKLLVDKPI